MNWGTVAPPPSLRVFACISLGSGPPPVRFRAPALASRAMLLRWSVPAPSATAFVFQEMFCGAAVSDRARLFLRVRQGGALRGDGSGCSSYMADDGCCCCIVYIRCSCTHNLPGCCPVILSLTRTHPSKIK